MIKRFNQIFSMLFVAILLFLLCIELVYPIGAGYYAITSDNIDTTDPTNIQTYTYSELPDKMDNYQTDSFVELPFANNYMLFHAQYEEKSNIFSDFSLKIFEPLEEFPAKFENYFSDHIPYKKAYIKGLANFRYFFLGDSVNSEVMIGKDDWLFYAPNVDMLGRDISEEYNKQLYVKKINECEEYVEKNGGKFVFMLAPNKVSIYKDYLPSGYYIDDSIYTQDIIDYIKKNTKCPIIYPYQNLIDNKKQYPLYYKLDTHWNQLGAYIGYSALAEELGEQKPLLSEKRIMSTTYNHGDLARFLGLNDEELHDKCYFFQNDNEVCQGELVDEDGFNYLRFQNPKGNGKKILVFRDSFCTGMIPYFTEDYSECVFYWQAFDEEIVEKEQADIVLYQLVERSIGQLSSGTS